MDYYTSWTISSVAKLITAALDKTGKAGVFVLIGGVTAGGYLAYKKITNLEYRVRELEYKIKFGGVK